MKIEVRRRWVFLYLSLAVAFFLRQHSILLLTYISVVVVTAMLGMVLLPARLRRAEQAYRTRAMQLLTQREFGALDQFTAQQKLLKWFGPRHLLAETQGMTAAGRGDHEGAITHFERALQSAPLPHYNRIRLNLARELSCRGDTAAARTIFEEILRLDETSADAWAGLGLILAQEGTDPRLAILHLETALAIGIPRDMSVQLTLAELRIQLGDSRWVDAMERARQSGAPTEKIHRLKALAAQRNFEPPG